MPSTFRFCRCLKPSLVIIAVAFAIYAFPTTKTDARSTGPDAGYTNAPGESNCTGCHTDFALNTGGGSISIFGVPRNYVPNQTVTIRVKVTHSGAMNFGFQLTALDDAGNRAGTLVVTDPIQTQTINNNLNTRTYMEQTFDGSVPTVAGEKEWTFMWQAPATFVGRVNFYATGNGGNGNSNPGGDHIYSATARIGSAPSDFDGDARTDLSVFRASNGVWYVQRSQLGFTGINFGSNQDVIAPGDYDGDNRTDVAVFRPSAGYWYYLQSSNGAFVAIPFGTSGDQPVAADYDGDGKTDVALFRPSSATWYYLRSTDGGFRFVIFGVGGDKLVPSDYDGDGKADIGVFRASTGWWYYLQSSDGAFRYAQFGIGTDRVVVADYDGDGKADFGAYRPSNGTWYVLNSSNGSLTVRQFGTFVDRPSPGDYDGDSKSDIAVFRPTDGNWYLLNSSDGSFFGQQFGTANDLSVPGAHVPWEDIWVKRSKDDELD